MHGAGGPDQVDLANSGINYFWALSRESFFLLLRYKGIRTYECMRAKKLLIWGHISHRNWQSKCFFHLLVLLNFHCIFLACFRRNKSTYHLMVSLACQQPGSGCCHYIFRNICFLLTSLWLMKCADVSRQETEVHIYPRAGTACTTASTMTTVAPLFVRLPANMIISGREKVTSTSGMILCVTFLLWMYCNSVAFPPHLSTGNNSDFQNIYK